MSSRMCRAALVLLAWTSLLVGCGPGFNEMSGDDVKRRGALPIMPDVPGDDRVSSEQGDHTDWKTFELGAEDNVRIRLWWDDPEVEAQLSLYSGRGRGLGDVTHEPGARYDELGPIGLGAGQYFLKIETTDGVSVY
ncbi:MAG: hypothetical protein QF464_21230, partial [Myxococcota bacterium]|nr:hypothetical protein [Myxococcota bacterium]